MSLSLCGGQSSLSRAPLKHGGGLTSGCEEEGLRYSLKRGQSHKLDLTDFKETLPALDESSEIRWLSELFALCSQSFMNMGNQQGTKIKPDVFTEDELFRSATFQMYRKRRRVYTDNLQNKLKMAPGNPLKARRLSKLRIMNSSGDTFEKEEDRSILCAPVSKRKRSTGKERATHLNATNNSPQNLISMWDAPSSLHFTRSSNTKAPVSTKKPVKEEWADSETDLSEYDNETSFGGSTKMSPGSTETIQTVESSLQMFDEIGKHAATRRGMGKIQEVEGIIRRVSFTSSDLMKEDDQDGFVKVAQELRISKPLPEYDSKFMDRDFNDNKPLLMEELCALKEALSKTLQQALKIDGEKTAWKSTKMHSYQHTEAKKRPQHHPLNPSYCKSNRSSPPISVDPETTSSSSPSLSPVLDISTRTSSNFESRSPIMSPLLSPISTSPVPQIQKECTEGSWGSTITASGNYNKINLDWTSEHNQTYTEANNTEDGHVDLLHSGKMPG